MTSSTSTQTGGRPGTPTGPLPVQVHSVYIKAPAERIWAAITDPEWNGRYGYGAPSSFELPPAARSRPSPARR